MRRSSTTDICTNPSPIACPFASDTDHAHHDSDTIARRFQDQYTHSLQDHMTRRVVHRWPFVDKSRL